ncbi:hypothetical protein HCTV5_159 [Halovirus HCTV-5]|uniref:hypothetical protein n=1 Tax=Halovirus HCTV-5 TaxID=1273748 RepID=UPI00033481F7|nr:hypothetical protein M200_gp071 [Halovirus HCTV-5]AGM11763.1 hypothetical protein HCTV5_159 [Halovirus HCTV-5]
MKLDMGYCPKCNCTTENHDLAHVHEEHFGESPQILGLLPMWYNSDHSGPQRAGEFWARRLTYV